MLCFGGEYSQISYLSATPGRGPKDLWCVKEGFVRPTARAVQRGHFRVSVALTMKTAVQNAALVNLELQ